MQADKDANLIVGFNQNMNQEKYLDHLKSKTLTKILNFDKVKEGDTVKKGQLLFSDKKTPGVKFTAPAAGTVVEINRGARRVFQSLVIELAGEEEETFAIASKTTKEDIVTALVDSGLWATLRTRPFSKIPAPQSQADALFINAMDTNPLAADPEAIINERKEDFAAGLSALALLTPKTYLCKKPGSQITAPSSVQVEEFEGLHPAGLSGTHIHFLHPVGGKRRVWTINYQDVLAVGYLVNTGKLDSRRVVAITGPQASKPRLVRTVAGADLSALCKDEQKTGENRLVSGSVFSGATASGAEAFLGRFDLQVSILKEGHEREFLRYLSFSPKRHSKANIYLSRLFPKKRMAMTTSTNGSERAMVPLGLYEEVMPLDILPTQLLRALLVGDMETAVGLGALELAEEDLALCTYVCPGKYEYGPILRDLLTQIEKEGI